MKSHTQKKSLPIVFILSTQSVYILWDFIILNISLSSCDFWFHSNRMYKFCQLAKICQIQLNITFLFIIFFLVLFKGLTKPVAIKTHLPHMTTLFSNFALFFQCFWNLTMSGMYLGRTWNFRVWTRVHSSCVVLGGMTLAKNCYVKIMFFCISKCKWIRSQYLKNIQGLAREQ